ncbi:gp53-like domain-containing protein [Photorhabdus khanii]|uniref:gp53-like domain-containing protein n=2 Tax=Photorhabdus khanii TaxID=1004150 RepID=UPI0039C3FCBF
MGTYTTGECDGRFQFKGNYASVGQSYTKSESDSRFSSKNTASKAANGWWKCGDTGMIYQWGEVTRTDNDTRVNFPILFPTKCINVQISMSFRPYSSSSNISAYNVTTNGFTYYGEANELRSFWFAVGY